MRQELLGNEILHADETTLKVLREEKQKCYVWVYRTSGDALRPVVLYDYQPSRAGTCASSFLQGFSGLLHTDGYEVYHCKLPPEITVAGCWAHMRRKFTDTLKALPRQTGNLPAVSRLEHALCGTQEHIPWVFKVNCKSFAHIELLSGALPL